jgi:tripartite ATP-independent transporter DctM subunit
LEWQYAALIIFGALILLMATGMPVAFVFLLINVVGVFFLWGGQSGLEQLTGSIYRSLASFTLMPLVLFIVLGEIMFQSKVAPLMISAVDKWLGRVPGRLSFLAVLGGTIFATMSGSSMASVAMLGSTLIPEMEKRGYKKPMTLGPILGSGGLAMLIPPSNMAIIFGAIAQVNIGEILIAIVVPGLMLAVIYIIYILIRCSLQPELAPPYEVPAIPLTEKLLALVKYVLPLGIIVFLIMGVIFLGIATPTEAAATGVAGALILALIYGGLSWSALKKTAFSTIRVSVMSFMIIAGATAFSQIVVFTGASQGMSQWVLGFHLEPIVLVIIMMAIVFILGMFMSPVAIMMICLPIFMPIFNTLNFSSAWFAALFILNSEIAGISPPFGMSLFVMKGVASPDTTMMDIFRAGLTFTGFSLFAMALILAFPIIALALPNMMK